MRSLGGNELGPECGMAIAEALKGNATLTSLESAGLPSNPPAHAGPKAYTLAAFALFTLLRRSRSLRGNGLGDEAGMALAEALKINTTLTYLESAALPSNPPAHVRQPP